MILLHGVDESMHELLDLVLLDLVAGEDETETEVDQPDCFVVTDGFLVSGVSFFLSKQEVLKDRVNVDATSNCFGDE